MIHEVVSFFAQTFSGQGPNANEQIKRAEQALNQYGGNPEFCCCLFKIIVSNEMSISIRKSASIYLTNMILFHYDDIPSQSNELIIRSLPELLLLNSNTNILEVLTKLIRFSVCNCA